MTKILNGLKDSRAIKYGVCKEALLFIPFLLSNSSVSHSHKKLKLVDCQAVVIDPNNNLLPLYCPQKEVDGVMELRLSAVYPKHTSDVLFMTEKSDLVLTQLAQVAFAS